MKKNVMLLMLAALLSFSFYLQAEVYDWKWAVRAGDEGRDIIWDIALDDNGNTFVVGIFSERTLLGEIELTARGDTDVIVAKKDAEGTWLWAKRAGGMSNSNGLSITLDNDNNVYIMGNYWEEGDFGETVLPGGGGFIAKLDTDGNWLWAKKAGNVVTNAAVCSQSNIFITGNFTETAYFDEIQLISEGTIDIFVAKIDSSGNWIWAERAGGGSTTWTWIADAGRDIAIDGNSNIFVSGQFTGRGYFGDIRLRSAGRTDIFVAKLDSEGNWIWANRAGGESDISNTALTLDEEHNCYITGVLYGTVYFDEFELQELHSGNGDVYVAKIDSEGNWRWATQANARSGGGNNILFNDNRLFVTGTFRGPALFDDMEIAFGSYVMLAGLDTDGNWSSLSLGTVSGQNSYSFSTGLGVDKDGLINIAGHFSHTLRFGNIELNSTGIDDMFIAKVGIRESSGVEDIVDIENNCTTIHTFSDTRIKIQFDGHNPAQRITSWFFNVHPGEFGVTYPPESPVTHIAPGFWDIRSDHPEPGTYNLTLYAANVPGANNPESLHLLKRENPVSPWQDSGKPDAVNGHWLTWNELTGFSEFTFGGFGENYFGVELSSFTAELTPELYVQLKWVSEEENNLLGYNLYRANSDELSDSQRINVTLIPAVNTSEPEKYTFFDETVETGKSYYYWLQITDLDLSNSYYGPISLDIEDESSVPIVGTENKLYQNFPNPFNPETTISFSLQEDQKRLELSIYDIRGRVIRELIPQGQHCKGEYHIVWDGKDEKGNDAASGVYFYRLVTDSYDKTNKLLLLK